MTGRKPKWRASEGGGSDRNRNRCYRILALTRILSNGYPLRGKTLMGGGSVRRSGDGEIAGVIGSTASGPQRQPQLWGAHHEFSVRRLVGRRCLDLRHRFRCGLSGAQAGRMDREGLQIPHRRDDAGAAASLHDDRRTHRPAGTGAARIGRLGGQHADAGLRRRAVRPGPAAGCREILHHHSGRRSATANRRNLPTA